MSRCLGLVLCLLRTCTFKSGQVVEPLSQRYSTSSHSILCTHFTIHSLHGVQDAGLTRTQLGRDGRAKGLKSCMVSSAKRWLSVLNYVATTARRRQSRSQKLGTAPLTVQTWTPASRATASQRLAQCIGSPGSTGEYRVSLVCMAKVIELTYLGRGHTNLFVPVCIDTGLVQSPH